MEGGDNGGNNNGVAAGVGGKLHWRTIPVAGAVIGRCCHGASPVACAVVVIIIQGLRPPSINLSVCLLIVES